MWAFLYGELGLAPADARGLDWVQVYHYQQGYEVRLQKQLFGFRKVAAQVYNATFTPVLSEQEYYPLPLIDRLNAAPIASPTGETPKEFRDRLAAQNAQKLAARATPQHGN